LQRFSTLRTALLNPYAILVRASDLPFDLDEPVDERRCVLAMQVVRDGANLFRESVGAAWGNRCAISKISVPQVLDAAHIYPYKGPATDNLRNAILLRNDLHTLFDAFMLSLEYIGDVLTVRISRKLGNTPYTKLEGKTIRLPVDPFHQPADKVVRHHFSKFRDIEQR
jgi:putative restriction endonuclease